MDLVRRSRHPGVVLTFAVILAVAAALRLWGVTWGLPHAYHPDEGSILIHALGFGTGDLNPHWFRWPSLFMYIVSGHVRRVLRGGHGLRQLLVGGRPRPAVRRRPHGLLAHRTPGVRRARRRDGLGDPPVRAALVRRAGGPRRRGVHGRHVPPRARLPLRDARRGGHVPRGRVAPAHAEGARAHEPRGPHVLRRLRGARRLGEVPGRHRHRRDALRVDRAPARPRSERVDAGRRRPARSSADSSSGLRSACSRRPSSRRDVLTQFTMVSHAGVAQEAGSFVDGLREVFARTIGNGVGWPIVAARGRRGVRARAVHGRRARVVGRRGRDGVHVPRAAHGVRRQVGRRRVRARGDRRRHAHHGQALDLPHAGASGDRGARGGGARRGARRACSARPSRTPAGRTTAAARRGPVVAFIAVALAAGRRDAGRRVRRRARTRGHAHARASSGSSGTSRRGPASRSRTTAPC